MFEDLKEWSGEEMDRGNRDRCGKLITGVKLDADLW